MFKLYTSNCKRKRSESFLTGSNWFRDTAMKSGRLKLHSGSHGGLNLNNIGFSALFMVEDGRSPKFVMVDLFFYCLQIHPELLVLTYSKVLMS
jgi:hypothetical protein